MLEAGASEAAGPLAADRAGRAGGAGHAARLADGAARPARPGGQGGGAGRGRDRPGVLPRAARRGGGPRARRAGGGARPARRRRAGLPARRAAGGRATCSSTRWCGTRPTARSCATGGGGSTPASRTPWRSGSRSWPETPPELLAHHLTEAGEAERAVALLARGRPAVGRALGRPGGGQPPPPGPGAARRPAGLGRAGPHRARLPARDRDAADRALRLERPAGRSGLRAGRRALRRAWARPNAWSRPSSAWPATASCAARRGRRSALAERCRAAAERRRDPVDRLLAHRATGAALMQLGDLRQARAEFEAIPALYDPERDRDLAARCVTDPRASGLSFLALVLWIMGYPDQARRTADEAARYAAALQHANTTGHILCHGGGGELAQLLRDVPATRGYAEAVIDARGRARHADVARLRPGPARLGPSPKRGGPRRGRRSCARASRSWMRSARCSTAPTISGSSPGSTPGSATRPRACGCWRRRTSEVARTEVRLFEAELRRLEGELRLLGGAPEAEAEACFVEALAVARRQEAKSFELRAATRLARLWQEQGRRFRGARPARASLRLVHRRLRHAGPA